jgi:hypothetical protein
MPPKVTSTHRLPDYEHREQTTFFNLLSRVNHPAALVTFAIPNQAVAKFRSKAMRIRFWKEGVRAGVPDIFVSYPMAPFHGLYIENKTPGEKPSKEQVAWHERLRAAGYRVEVCFSARQQFEVFCDYLDITPFRID